MVGYLKYLRSLTGGRGTFVMSFDRFEKMSVQRQKGWCWRRGRVSTGDERIDVLTDGMIPTGLIRLDGGTFREIKEKKKRFDRGVAM